MNLSSFCQIFADLTQYRTILTAAGESGEDGAIGNQRFARIIIGKRTAASGGLGIRGGQSYLKHDATINVIGTDRATVAFGNKSGDEQSQPQVFVFVVISYGYH